MKDQLKIPEGYTPIEYIEYHPKQTHLFSFGQFERFKEAFELSKRINASCGENVCKITNIQLPEDVLFCIIFPETVFEKVDYINREECAMCESSSNVVYNIPILYRFLDIKGEYVDMFFETGKLKLSTFENCKKLEDENRKDTKEGQSDLYGYDGDIKMQIGVGVGSDAIMLCTSLCSDYKDKKGTVYDKYIEIFDAQGLLFAIADQLIKNGYVIKNILFGPCFYTKKEFHNTVCSETFREKLDKEQAFDWDEILKIANYIGGNNIFFQKPIDKRLENEFRLLWVVDNIKKDQDIFVTIPHPETYCKLKERSNMEKMNM